MDKLTYLAELAEGLARWVPERERQDILRYYAEYFEEAGPDREAEVIRELGDPWALSCRLAVEGGFVTQEQAEGWTPPPKKKWPLVLIGAAAVLVLLIGSAVSAAAWFGRTIFAAVTDTTPVQTYYGEVIASVEEDTGFEPSSSDVVFIEGEETDGGFWSMEDGYLEAFDTIDAEIGLGSVTVTEGEDYTLVIQYENKPENYEITWEIRGGALKIRDNKDGKGVSLNGLFESTDIQVIVTVPDTEVLKKLSASTGVGSVYLSGMAAEEVKVNSGTGSVKCYGLRQVEELELTSGTGSVTLEMEELWQGAEIDLESGTGSIKAVLGCDERDCAYKLETGLGSVRVNGVSQGKEAKQGGNLPYNLEAESGTGSVKVEFAGN